MRSRSGGLPQVRHTPRAERAGSNTRSRALFVCGQRLITPSIISEKLKVNGSLARKAIKELASKSLIRPTLTHKHQAIYTRASNS